MSEVHTYIGRQPIFDRDSKNVAYELLYRTKGENSATIHNDMNATARVIINLMQNIGITSLIGDKIGFINVSENTILSEHIFALPKELFVFEILEYTKISPELIDRIRYLHESGYRFALDDFTCTDATIQSFILLFPYIDIVKIDLLLDHNIEIEKMAEELKLYDVKLLAEKVENMEMFERCKLAGFELFQGYFFEKPTIISGKKIEPGVLNVIDLINTFHTTSNIDEITRKFLLYPDLTFNLLRYINSAAYSFSHEISNIKHILVLLGPARLRSWLGLFLYAGEDDRIFKEAIFNGARFRAKMMHNLVKACGKPEMADEAYLTGSLSLIDTYLQISMDSIIDQICLSTGINDALLFRQGYLGKLLMITEKLEITDKIQTIIEDVAPKIQLSPDQLYTIYMEANIYMLEKE